MLGAEGPAAVVDIRPPGLDVLEPAGDLVELPILDEPCPGLLEQEGYPRRHALAAQVQNPLVPAYPCARPGFAPRHHLGDVLPQPGGQVDGAQQRLAGDGLVPDGGGLQDGQPEIGPLLVLRRGADGHVAIALPPVRGQMVRQAVDALGDEKEIKVGAHLHHSPGPGPPFVRVLQQKVRRKAGPHHVAGRDGPAPVPLLAQGQVVGLGAVHLGGVQPPAGVPPVDIAVGAAGGGLMAPVPGIPAGHVNPGRQCTAGPRPAAGRCSPRPARCPGRCGCGPCNSPRWACASGRIPRRPF